MVASANDDRGEKLLELASEVAAAYVSYNPVPVSELSATIRSIHSALAALDRSGLSEPLSLKPAVAIKKSVTETHIICLEDGKKLKMLKRYLGTHYRMSPEDYRAKWGLPLDYPMVAPNYSAKRSELAKKIGLGKSPDKRKGRKRADRSSSVG
ncbi:MAG TPA: MucR family transcriptional regulator [Rhizomicrobium sp.]